MNEMINRISAAKPLIMENAVTVGQIRQAHKYDGYDAKKTRNIAILTFFVSYIPFVFVLMLLCDALLWDIIKKITGVKKVTDFQFVVFLIVATALLVFICVMIKKRLDVKTGLSRIMAERVDAEAKQSGLMDVLYSYLYDVPMKYWSEKHIDIICNELSNGTTDDPGKAVVIHNKKKLKKMFLIVAGIAAIPLAIIVIKNVVTFVFYLICAIVIGTVTFKFMNIVTNDAISGFEDTMNAIGSGIARSMDESAERGRIMHAKNENWKSQTANINRTKEKAVNYLRHGNVQGANYYANEAKRQTRERNKDYYE